jgi:hypothetical protein
MAPPLIIAAVLLALVSPVFAADEAGTIKTSRGDAHIVRDAQPLPASVGSPILVSDSVITGADGAVGITLKDNTRLTAGPDTRLELNKFHFDTTSHEGVIDSTVQRGSLSVISGKVAKASPDGVRFHTPTVTLGVRGTEFIIETGLESN